MSTANLTETGMRIRAGGTPCFSSNGRRLEQEHEIELLSVGVDIGSSTTQVIFSRINMERVDSRYVVSRRELIYQSEILLTPYAEDTTIDAAALGRFIAAQYDLAGITPQQIDSGALILTGVAVRRTNARAIGELFADQAGKLVAVTAGDALETTLIAFGSGAVAATERDGSTVMNVDIGGGTSKIAICAGGKIVDMTVIDVGARIICFDEDGRVSSIEEAARHFAAEAGVALEIGAALTPEQVQRIVSLMADRLFEAMGARPLGRSATSLLRLEPLQPAAAPDVVTFSGGVSEYIYGRENRGYGDLGPRLAAAIGERMREWTPRMEATGEGIRATVLGASQYTVQVSGNTIFVTPEETLPLRNVPVVQLELPRDDAFTPERVSEAVRQALRRHDLEDSSGAVALCFRWHGSATYARLDALCHGIVRGLESILAKGLPLVLVNDKDIGGLVGLHCARECGLRNPVVSIDGIILKEFDFIDIGGWLDASGAVPVVIKSLLFPSTGLGGYGRDAASAAGS